MSIEKRLERIEAILDARGLDWDHPRVDEDHFADADKMVDDEPAKEPEHPAGPMPDPGKAYRLLSKDPPEDLQPGDEYRCRHEKQWIESNRVREGYRNQLSRLWYRRKIEQLEPAWEPKVGDWVRVTRPENWKECADPCWAPQMHHYDGKVGKIEGEWEGRFHICGFALPNGLRLIFDRDWLSPAEPPEPEYREPVLPADLGKWAEFSHDGINWMRYKLRGCHKESEASLTIWSEKNIGFRHCRIKKDA